MLNTFRQLIANYYRILNKFMSLYSLYILCYIIGKHQNLCTLQVGIHRDNQSHKQLLNYHKKDMLAFFLLYHNLHSPHHSKNKMVLYTLLNFYSWWLHKHHKYLSIDHLCNRKLANNQDKRDHRFIQQDIQCNFHQMNNLHSRLDMTSILLMNLNKGCLDKHIYFYHQWHP